MDLNSLRLRLKALLKKHLGHQASRNINLLWNLLQKSDIHFNPQVCQITCTKPTPSSNADECRSHITQNSMGVVIQPHIVIIHLA
jgi:hypothetical protein